MSNFYSPQSSRSSQRKSSGGVGLPTVVLVVFVILKLVGVIEWSWWWVLSPFWIPAGIAVVILVVWLLIKLGSYWARNRKRVARAAHL